MKREDVSKIIPGITSDQLDSIMNLHGADITAKVNEITTLKAEKTTLTEQLSTANSKLEATTRSGRPRPSRLRPMLRLRSLPSKRAMRWNARLPA